MGERREPFLDEETLGGGAGLPAPDAPLQLGGGALHNYLHDMDLPPLPGLVLLSDWNEPALFPHSGDSLPAPRAEEAATTPPASNTASSATLNVDDARDVQCDFAASSTTASRSLSAASASRRPTASLAMAPGEADLTRRKICRKRARTDFFEVGHDSRAARNIKAGNPAGNVECRAARHAPAKPSPAPMRNKPAPAGKPKATPARAKKRAKAKHVGKQRSWPANDGRGKHMYNNPERQETARAGQAQWRAAVLKLRADAAAAPPSQVFDDQLATCKRLQVHPCACGHRCHHSNLQAAHRRTQTRREKAERGTARSSRARALAPVPMPPSLSLPCNDWTGKLLVRFDSAEKPEGGHFAVSPSFCAGKTHSPWPLLRLS